MNSPPILEPILVGDGDVHWGYGSLTHGQIVAAAFLLLYMVLGRPFYYRVLSMTQVTVQEGEIQAAIARKLGSPLLAGYKRSPKKAMRATLVCQRLRS